LAREEIRTWQGSHDLGIDRRLRRNIQYAAYVPDPLVGRPVLLPPDVAAALGQAEMQVRELNESEPMVASLEAVARLLLRAEAVASSKIEGYVVGARRLLRAEAGHDIAFPTEERRDATAETVLGNIEAMQIAVGELTERSQLKLDDLLMLHEALMRHTGTPELGGKIRTTQNWIGTTDHGPYDADYVPPPPEYVVELLNDLVAYMNEDEHPALLQAALAHAQFEAIHPFGDGNGRVGRAIIHTVLRRRGLARRFVPPISMMFKTYSRDYIRGLTATHYLGEPDGKAAVESTAEWLRVFTTAVSRAVADAGNFGRRIDALEGEWRRQATPVRRGSAADLLISALVSAPVVTVATAAKLINRSEVAANAAVEQLRSAGVLIPMRDVRRNRAFEAKGFVELFTLFEREMASPAGDTRKEPPVGPSPALPQERHGMQAREVSGDRQAPEAPLSDGGPVHVLEYRRKDSSVVRAHTRNSPRKP
jgi:Fic family protein